MSHEYSIGVSASMMPTNPAVSVTAEITRRATSESPIRLRLSLRNRGCETKRLDLGFTPPFSKYVLTEDDDSSALVLVPPNYSGFQGVDEVETRRNGVCWTAKAVPEVLETGTLRTLDSDEEIEREYILLNHPENPSCFPPGRYSRRDTIIIDDYRFELELVSVVEEIDNQGT